MSERQQRQRRQRQQVVAQSQRQAAHVTQPQLVSAASRAEERFQAFMRAHPAVYSEFKRRALALHRRGWRHFGGKAIAESIRYETALNAATPDEPWRLNNNHISRMVRQVIAEEPELAGFFSLRELRSA